MKLVEENEEVKHSAGGASKTPPANTTGLRRRHAPNDGEQDEDEVVAADNVIKTCKRPGQETHRE